MEPRSPSDSATLEGVEGYIAATEDRRSLPEHRESSVETQAPSQAATDRVLAAALGEANEEPGGKESSRGLARGTLVGRYVVLEKLGAGGMGVVYAAYDPDLDRKVAIKLLLPGRGGDRGREQLQREAKALGKLAHPNIVAIHDVGTVGEQVWLAMEFVKGRTLGVWLGEPRGWREVVAVMRSAGEGLAAAHAAGLLHRDFKPENVMVADDDRVRVMDFGLACMGPEGAASAVDSSEQTTALANQLTEAGAIIGTPPYMAPEQWESRELTAAADQFAFCVTLWEALYSQRPFEDGPALEIAANILAGRRRSPPKDRHVPNRLRLVCERGLSVDPRQRWPSMEALLEALAWDPSRWRSRALLSLGAVVVSSVAVVSYQAWTQGRAQRCSGAQQRLAGVWDDETRARVQLAFAAVDKSYAEQAWRRT